MSSVYGILGQPSYGNILSRIRIGNIIDEDMKLLKDLENTNTDNFLDSTVKIFLTNKQVATFNDEKWINSQKG